MFHLSDKDWQDLQTYRYKIELAATYGVDPS